MKRSGSKGQSLVETALVLAAFLTLLVGMGFAGQSLFIQQTLTARVHEAARWGALHDYDAQAIRNIVLYGKADTQADSPGFGGLSANDILVSKPGCPGPDCRILVTVPSHGIRGVEPARSAESTDAAASTP